MSNFRCFKYKDNKPITETEYLEQKYKSSLLPNGNDRFDDEEVLYWQLRNYCYLACNGHQNPHLVDVFYSEMDYYKVFELLVHHTVYSISNS